MHSERFILLLWLPVLLEAEACSVAVNLALAMKAQSAIKRFMA
jgi:hypothetical protein